MGNLSSLRNASAFAAAAFLTGCNDLPKTWTRAEIDEIASAHSSPFKGEFIADLSERLQAVEIENNHLESDNRLLHAEINLMAAQIKDLQSAQDSLVETVNHNVEVANRNAHR